MKYNYIGLYPDQTVAKGILDVASEVEARSLLDAKKVQIIFLQRKAHPLLEMEVSIGHVSDVQLLFFVKHLAIMLQAGIPLYEGLTMLKEQAKGRLRYVLKRVLDSVSAGNKLSDSLAKFPKDFPDLIVQLIGGGEASGTLQTNLEYIATFLDKEIDLKKKIRAAMIYPVLVFIAVIGLGMSVGLFVLPQILPLFRSLDVDLPISTRVLLWLAEVFKDYGKYIVLVVAAVIIGTPILMELPPVRPISHRMYVRAPLFGKIVREVNLARFFRVFATLMSAGVDIDKALGISYKIIRNAAYKAQIKRMEKGVIKGDPISQVIQENQFLFPSIVTHMMRVGEKSGNLVDSLNYVGKFYESEVDNKVKNLATLLEPVLLIGIGLVVGFVAIAIIGPIYKITGSLR